MSSSDGSRRPFSCSASYVATSSAASCSLSSTAWTCSGVKSLSLSSAAASCAARNAWYTGSLERFVRLRLAAPSASSSALYASSSLSCASSASLASWRASSSSFSAASSAACFASCDARIVEDLGEARLPEESFGEAGLFGESGLRGMSTLDVGESGLRGLPSEAPRSPPTSAALTRSPTLPSRLVRLSAFSRRVRLRRGRTRPPGNASSGGGGGVGSTCTGADTLKSALSSLSRSSSGTSTRSLAGSARLTSSDSTAASCRSRGPPVARDSSSMLELEYGEPGSGSAGAGGAGCGSASGTAGFASSAGGSGWLRLSSSASGLVWSSGGVKRREPLSPTGGGSAARRPSVSAAATIGGTAETLSLRGLDRHSSLLRSDVDRSA